MLNPELDRRIKSSRKKGEGNKKSRRTKRERHSTNNRRPHEGHEDMKVLWMPLSGLL